MRKYCAVILPALLLGACAAPAARHAGQAQAGQANYVAPGQLLSVAFPPPPATGSDAERADLAAVHEWQGKRTEADCERTNKTFIVAFDQLQGERNPFVTPLPAGVRAFFARIDSDAGAAARAMKDRYQRPRPALPNPCPGLNVRMKAGGSYSYPSSHAVFSRVFADVLADLVPARKAEFISSADEIALDRVKIGVHYPSDIAAGKDFGDLFHAELLRTGAYRKDLEKMRSFLAK